MKTERLSQRVEPSILEDLRILSEETGLTQSSLVSACIKSLKKTWDDEGAITIPFRILPEKRYFELTNKQSKSGSREEVDS